MVAFHLKLLNTSDILAVLKLQQLILTEETMVNAHIDQELLSVTSDLEATTLLKEMKNKWLKDFIMPVQSLYPSNPLMNSMTTKAEFINKMIVEPQLKMLIMQF